MQIILMNSSPKTPSSTTVPPRCVYDQILVTAVQILELKGALLNFFPKWIIGHFFDRNRRKLYPLEV